MKKQLKVLTAMALILAALIVATAATENHEIIRINKGDAAKTIDIRLANLQRNITTVILQDMEGVCWYRESIRNEDGYSKRLNLNGMPNGYYFCYVNNRNVFISQHLYLSETDIVFLEPTQTNNPRAAFTVRTGSDRPVLMRITNEKPNTVCLQLANLQHQPTSIRLYTLGAGNAYHQKVSGEQAFAKSLNFDGMAAGTYFLSLNVGDAVVIQQIEYSPAGVRLGALSRLDIDPEQSAGLARN